MNRVLWLSVVLYATTAAAFVARNHGRTTGVAELSGPLSRLVKGPLILTRCQLANKENKDGMFPQDNKVKSKMPGYVASFLEKQKLQDNLMSHDHEDEYYTHMIGVPMEQSHGLMVQLESVQRAVIHHCPVLVKSAIVPVMTRLPMLYVDGRRRQGNNKSNVLVAQDVVTQELHEIIQRIVKKRIFVKHEQPDDDEEEEIDPMDDKDYMRGLNDKGYRPLVLTFEKLEVDGDHNDVLFTLAQEDCDQTQALKDLHSEIRSEIEALGYKTRLPPDEHNTDARHWRPRIPFMRLPMNFDEVLPPLDDDETYRKPEKGGNGISPIFWCKWWDDVFGQNTRLSEVGVYSRQPSFDNHENVWMDERTFYVPHETVEFPKGNVALTKDEAEHAAYQESRMAESEKEITGLANDDDIPDAMVQEARERLESDFNVNTTASSAPTADGLIGEMPLDGEGIISDSKDSTVSSNSLKDTEKAKASAAPKKLDKLEDDEILDDWMKERIRRIIEERDSVKERKDAEAPKQEKPPPMDENPVFEKYRETRNKKRFGMDGTKRKSSKKKDPLPDYPSREHFIGAWNFVLSPMPSEFELSGDEQADASKSDNIFLRVDGTIFGGPILDREHMHKAAGATWSIHQQEKSSMNSTQETTMLRIRLVVPPAKERILVMEGKVTRLMMPFDLQSTRSSFGIPMVEQATKTAEESSKYDNMLQCDGEMWFEDARTGANRENLGPFILMKMHQSNPKDYVITIPRSVRNID